MRYINLSTVLVLRLVSSNIHARFPTYEKMVEANLIFPEEAARLKAIDKILPNDSATIPITWAMTLIENARLEGKLFVSISICRDDCIMVSHKQTFPGNVGGSRFIYAPCGGSIFCASLEAWPVRHVAPVPLCQC